jgi:pimeloyl-ACP methyl ester carboxylesterase
MYERFHNRAPFSAWKPEILRDYCEYALLPDGDELTLACPGLIEAGIYERSNWPSADISADYSKMRVFTTVLRSAKLMTKEHFDLSASATDPNLASLLPHAQDVYLPDCSHFIPMEHPDLIVKALYDAPATPAE